MGTCASKETLEPSWSRRESLVMGHPTSPFLRIYGYDGDHMHNTVLQTEWRVIDWLWR